MNRLFEIFLSPEHVRSLSHSSISNLGVGIDELIRYHPSLKLPAIQSAIKMLEEICAKGMTKEQDKITQEKQEEFLVEVVNILGKVGSNNMGFSV